MSRDIPRLGSRVWGRVCSTSNTFPVGVFGLMVMRAVMACGRVGFFFVFFLAWSVVLLVACLVEQQIGTSDGVPVLTCIQCVWLKILALLFPVLRGVLNEEHVVWREIPINAHPNG